MKIVRPLALIAVSALLAVELTPSEHHKQQEHVESIPSTAVVSPAPISNTASMVVSNSPLVSPPTVGLILPESALHQFYISVG